VSAVHIVTGAGGNRRTLVRDGLIVALVSAKGSPGVTTAAVGLATRWPRPGAVVVEADPAGGDLAARFGRPLDPGLAAIALDSRDPGGEPDPRRWTQPLPCGVAAVLAPPGAAAAASLAELGPRTPAVLESLAGRHPVVVVDAGRWRPGPPAHPAPDPAPADLALAAADVVLLLARPVVNELRQVQARLPALRELAADLRLLLCGEADWPPAEVAASLRVPVAGVLPVDSHGAGVLSGRSVPRRGWASAGWTRLPLLRACRSLALTLHRRQPAVRPGSDRRFHPTGATR
jgi:hypothetical protein